MKHTDEYLLSVHALQITWVISEFHFFSCFAEVLQRHSKGDKTSDKYCKIAGIQWIQWSTWRWSNDQSLQWSSPFCKHERESCRLASTGNYCRRVWSLSRACQSLGFYTYFDLYLSFHRWWQLALGLIRCWVSAKLSFSGVVLSRASLVFYVLMQLITVLLHCLLLLSSPVLQQYMHAFMSCLQNCSFRCVVTLDWWSSLLRI